MGGGQSKTDTRPHIKDILRFLKDEVKKWDDNIKNLEESLRTGQPDWIPAYLQSNIEETEIKWENMRSLFKRQAPSTHHNVQDNDTQKAITGQVNGRETETDIRQLKANNQILLESKQAAEMELLQLRKEFEDYKRRIQKDRNECSNQTSRQQNEVISDSPEHQTSEESVKERSPEDRSETGEDETIEALKKRLKEKEENFKRNLTEQDEKFRILSTEKDTAEKYIKELKKELEDLSQRSKTYHETSGKRDSTTGTPDKLKGSSNDKKDISIQAVQKPRVGTEVEYRNEKLKMLEEQQVLSAEKESLETQVTELQKEKDALLLRLSRIAGDKLVDNNPAVTDLSDPNRPTKLGEVYSELYDNEWTDAFEAMKAAGHNEEEAIETLRLTLENVVFFCESKAELVLKKSSDAVNLLFEEYQRPDTEARMPSHLTVPRRQAQELRQQLLREKSSIEDLKLQKRWKPKANDVAANDKHKRLEKPKRADSPKVEAENKLKRLRKEISLSILPLVQKAYMEMNWSSDCLEDLKPYILKCLYLGWMMAVQSPPMALHKSPRDREEKFNKNIHKVYTSSGPIISYVVWPALLLQENGAIVCKGVAEGMVPSKQ